MSIEINGYIYRELRCPRCRKLICYEYIHSGRIAFNCPRCGDYNKFEFTSLEKKNTKDKLNIHFKMKGGDKK